MPIRSARRVPTAPVALGEPAPPRSGDDDGALRTMMEDAYNDAIASGRTHNEAVGAVITDFGNLDELAPVLGISADLQGDDDAAASRDTPAPNPAYPAVTLPQAQALARARA